MSDNNLSAELDNSAIDWLSEPPDLNYIPFSDKCCLKCIPKGNEHIDYF